MACIYCHGYDPSVIVAFVKVTWCGLYLLSWLRPSHRRLRQGNLVWLVFIVMVTTPSSSPSSGNLVWLYYCHGYDPVIVAFVKVNWCGLYLLSWLRPRHCRLHQGNLVWLVFIVMVTTPVIVAFVKVTWCDLYLLSWLRPRHRCLCKGNLV